MIALGGTIGIGLVIGTGTALRQGVYGNTRSSCNTTVHRWPTWNLARLFLCRCVLIHMYYDLVLTGGFTRVYLVRHCMTSFSTMPLVARASVTVSCKASERYNSWHCFTSFTIANLWSRWRPIFHIKKDLQGTHRVSGTPRTNLRQFRPLRMH